MALLEGLKDSEEQLDSFVTISLKQAVFPISIKHILIYFINICVYNILKYFEIVPHSDNKILTQICAHLKCRK